MNTHSLERVVTEISEKTVPIERLIAGASLFLASLLVTISVFLRYLFSYSIGEFVEITGYLIIWSTFFGASHLLYKNGHLTIDVLLIRVSERKKLVLQTFAYTCGTFFTLLLTFYGLVLVIQSIQLDVRSISALRTPMWIPQMVIPLGGSIMFIRFLQKALSHFRLLTSNTGGAETDR
jgi:TRAP-type C4-dicarboxylate transport system permease small subunit